MAESQVPREVLGTRRVADLVWRAELEDLPTKGGKEERIERPLRHDGKRR